MTHQADIRKKVLQKRQNLSSEFVQTSSIIICNKLAQEAFLRDAQKIACYLPYRNEVDLHPFIESLWKIQKEVYLPICRHDNTLAFGRYRADTPLAENRYKIPEPQVVKTIEAPLLDAALLPVVAFDEGCHRIGMGAGFYDKTFAFTKNTPRSKPHLIGVAFSCQSVETAHPQSWDIALDAIVTELASYY